MKLLRKGEITFFSAFIEILLIFVGITIAIGFDNWNDNRKDREQELEILENLKADLDVMITRSEEAVTFNSVCLHAGTTILKDLEDPTHTTYNDSLNKYYGTFYFYDYPEIKQSALLTLQATGVDLIRNDSLRSAVIDFYDLHSLKASYVGESYTDQYNDVIDPIMHGNIRILSVREAAMPIDYPKLKKDKIAQNTLNNILFHRLVLIGHISASIPKMEELQKSISHEIGRLK